MLESPVATSVRDDVEHYPTKLGAVVAARHRLLVCPDDVPARGPFGHVMRSLRVVRVQRAFTRGAKRADGTADRSL